MIRTLSERVFEIVRERIVTGQLPTDTPLRESTYRQRKLRTGNVA